MNLLRTTKILTNKSMINNKEVGKNKKNKKQNNRQLLYFELTNIYIDIIYFVNFFILFHGMKYDDTIIIIPSRFGSTRLNGKPLADINGIPMIVRVMNIAKSLDLCDVYVATDDNRIADVVTDNNGKVILTNNNLNSGTDRVFQALKKIKQKTKKDYDFIINLQGDMPDIDKTVIKKIAETLHHCAKQQLKKSEENIVTAIYKIVDQSWRKKSQCVKAIIAYNNKKNYHK